MGQQQKRVFDLDERTAKFAEAVIGFAKTIPVSPITSRLIDQLIGAATSVGANYREADDAVSKKDFHHRIGVCRKEAREAAYFIRMILAAPPQLKEPALPLQREAKELHLIFSKIFRA